MSHDHFAKNRKLAIDQLVTGLKKKKSSNDIFLIHTKYF